MKKILIISHYNFSKSGPIFGPTNSVCEYLRKRKFPYLLIAHPLYAGAATYKESFDGENSLNKKAGRIERAPFLLKITKEVIRTIKLTRGQSFGFAIGVDPHSTCTALLLKLFGRVQKVVFYSVDYADERFKNPLLNFAYQSVDFIATKFSDRVWSVSSRIYKKRLSMGVSKKSSHIVPNAPIFNRKNILPPDKVDRYSIVFISGLTHLPVFDLIISGFKRISKRYPKAKLKIIGEVTKKPELSDKVEFLGHLERPQMMKEIARCGVGVAVYTNDFPWTKYGDSMKARDYMSAGVPVVISDVVSTADDVKTFKAGTVIKPNQKEFGAALDKFLGSSTAWLEARMGAIELSKNFDLGKTLDNAFRNI